MNDEEKFLKNIQESLKEQVSEEMKDRKYYKKMSRKRSKKKKKIWWKVLLVIVLVLILGGAFLTLTPMGRKILIKLAVERIYPDIKKPHKNNSGLVSSTGSVEEELKAGEITDNINISTMSDTFKNARHEDGVYNVLLLGVEAIGNSGIAQGRTDSIMIATINTKKKTLGLTSLMRDSYVDIPGHGKNRINSVFGKGGIDLVYETIAQNYDLRLDGSAIVDFNTFQKIIDDLGGIDIEITKGEAKYLNTKNYISKKSNRTLHAGINHMNGNQALGYSRVRYEATLDGSHDDMGRTSRHRRVISAIFQKMKKSNPAKIISMFDTIFSTIQTDIKKDNAVSYLAELVELSIDGVSLDTLRLPENDALQPAKPNGMAVVLVDWEKTKKALHDFVFDTHVKKTATGAVVNKK